ncbi:uncharacterized protein LOC112576017 [Pomacea canaliculata]|uniref:uncharacterized protein LOC112576017 n=1 Tax=Pomacea canaliculata TaxID=400727 RepID=UPI000D73C952|nr:uncharacterized protein LOC112576017 [Pomacea canaliculata]XP_025113997.1 uncharacterized protein LOC112576017 [Pomacea canaliculata]XP_025113998.1 uncharacterized protein LOC112576017 [Pomacea canaliculata]
MTGLVYKTLVARFCGPATTVTVPCICIPRLSIKTLGQAVWWTGECYTAVITLFPEQVHLLHTAPPTLFVTGPPGTGKTVVLLLMAIQWLRGGYPVHVMMTCKESRAACFMLHDLLLKTHPTSITQLRLLQYDLTPPADISRILTYLSEEASKGSLYIVADEVASRDFKSFCEKLPEIPNLHFWAASVYHGDAPAGWPVEILTRPLRSPPTVVREVEQDQEISEYKDVETYAGSDVPDHTDGPPIRRLYHRGEGHSVERSVDCATCGLEVASLLLSLHVGQPMRVAPSTAATTVGAPDPTPCLQWKDVLVLYWYDVSDSSGAVTAMRQAGIPVRLMRVEDAEDVATRSSDVVWVADGALVRGLERKVVVCLEYSDVNFAGLSSLRLHAMSRCTSQLVIIYPEE